MIRTIWLTEDDRTRTDVDVSRVRDIVEEKEGALWLDIEEPAAGELGILEEVFEFHPLALEDVAEDAHYPKLEDFGGVLLITIQSPMPAEKITDPELEELTKEIDIFLGRNFLVTSHKKISPTVRAMMNRPEINGKSILDDGPDMLVQRLMERIMAAYNRAVDKLLLRAESLEDEVVVTDELEEILHESMELKKTTMSLRRILGYHRDILWQLSNKPFTVIRKNTRKYFRNIFDHVDQLNTKLDLCREMLTNARDLHLSLTSQRTNDVMRVLAVVSTILLPLTFITGLFGMNFDLPGSRIPISGNPYTFWIALAAMFVLAAVLLFIFKKKKWI